MTAPTLFQRALAVHIANVSKDYHHVRASRVSCVAAGLLLAGLVIIWLIGG